MELWSPNIVESGPKINISRTHSCSCEQGPTGGTRTQEPCLGAAGTVLDVYPALFNCVPTCFLNREKLPEFLAHERVWSFLMGVGGRANTPLCAAMRATIAKTVGSRPSNKAEGVGESGASSATKRPLALVHHDMLPELMRIRKYFER